MEAPYESAALLVEPRYQIGGTCGLDPRFLPVKSRPLVVRMSLRPVKVFQAAVGVAAILFYPHISLGRYHASSVGSTTLEASFALHLPCGVGEPGSAGTLPIGSSGVANFLRRDRSRPRAVPCCCLKMAPALGADPRPSASKAAVQRRYITPE